MANSTYIYVHSFVYSFSFTPYFFATGTFYRAVCSSVLSSQNFHTKQTSATSSNRVVHRQLHILTRVAMQNILSLRNHVSRRVASSVVYHNEDLQSTLCTRLRYDSFLPLCLCRASYKHWLCTNADCESLKRVSIAWTEHLCTLDKKIFQLSCFLIMESDWHD